VDEKYEHFRRQAQDCIEAASHAKDLGMKADWLLLAAKWLEMVPPEAQNEDERFGGMTQSSRTERGHWKPHH
jgi:hypothetical protein